MGGGTWDFQGIFILSFLSPFLFHCFGAEKSQPFTIKGKRTNAGMGSRGADPPRVWVAKGENIFKEPMDEGRGCE